VMAPIYTGLALAFLLACLLPASALARGQALAVGSSTIYSHISVGENGNLRVRVVADSGLAVGSIFGFTYCDQNRDRLKAGVIDRITSEPGSSDDAGGILALPRYAHAKGARLGAVRGLGDFLKEMISAQAAGPEGDLVDRGPVPLAEREREQAGAMPAEYLKGHRLGQRSAAH
jgi:hypothetical protein